MHYPQQLWIVHFPLEFGKGIVPLILYRKIYIKNKINNPCYSHKFTLHCRCISSYVLCQRVAPWGGYPYPRTSTITLSLSCLLLLSCEENQLRQGSISHFGERIARKIKKSHTTKDSLDSAGTRFDGSPKHSNIIMPEKILFSRNLYWFNFALISIHKKQSIIFLFNQMN